MTIAIHSRVLSLPLRLILVHLQVTNMATIIEVITLLEKVTITKELLEATRLGKHINELRKHLANDTLAKRVKLLVKKWRNIVLVANPPDVSALPVPVATNGQIRPSAAPLDEGGGKKRPPSRLDHTPTHVKKHRANGGGTAPPFDYDFSDNSNSSFKDIVSSTPAKQPVTLVVVNSDSNSSTSAQDALLRESAYDDQIPKKRGRKKGKLHVTWQSCDWARFSSCGALQARKTTRISSKRPSRPSPTKWPCRAATPR